MSLESILRGFCVRKEVEEAQALLCKHANTQIINVAYDDFACFKLATKLDQPKIFGALLSYYKSTKLQRDGDHDNYIKSLHALREAFAEIVESFVVPDDIRDMMRNYLSSDTATDLRDIKRQTSKLGLRVPCLDDLDKILDQEDIDIKYVRDVYTQLQSIKQSLDNVQGYMHIARYDEQINVVNDNIDFLESQYDFVYDVKGSSNKSTTSTISIDLSNDKTIRNIDNIEETKLLQDDALRSVKLNEQDLSEIELVEDVSIQCPTDCSNIIPMPHSLNSGYSIEVKTINKLLSRYQTYEEQIEALTSAAEGIKNWWAYVYYNELAKLCYKYSVELSSHHQIAQLQEVNKLCVAYITKSKNIIEEIQGHITDQSGHLMEGCNTKNAYYKSIVFYNYSQFMSKLSGSDAACRQDVVSAINTASDLCAASMAETKLEQKSQNLKQDCMVQKAFILSTISSDYIAESNELYKCAFKENPFRFLEEYTFDGTGRELIFWAILNNAVDVLDLLIEYHSATECSTINANIQNELEISPLLFAARKQNDSILKEHIMKQLMRLGADPLLQEDEDHTVLFYSLQEKGFDRSVLLTPNIQARIEDNLGDPEMRLLKLMLDDIKLDISCASHVHDTNSTEDIVLHAEVEMNLIAVHETFCVDTDI